MLRNLETLYIFAIFKTIFQEEAMKTYTLEELTDKYIGEVGTPKRDKFEDDLRA